MLWAGKELSGPPGGGGVGSDLRGGSPRSPETSLWMEWDREPFPEKVGQEGQRPMAWLFGGGGEEGGCCVGIEPDPQAEGIRWDPDCVQGPDPISLSADS